MGRRVWTRGQGVCVSVRWEWRGGLPTTCVGCVFFVRNTLPWRRTTFDRPLTAGVCGESLPPTYCFT